MAELIIINIILIAAITYMVCDTAAVRHRQKRQINVYIDETNSSSSRSTSEESKCRGH